MERGFLWVAEVLFILALGMFFRALVLRRDLPRHKRWAGGGVILVVSGLIVLEIVKRGLGWEFPIRDRTVLLWHIGFATTSLVLLAVQTLSGVLRWRTLHVKAWPLTIAAFSTTIVLSFFAFRLW